MGSKLLETMSTDALKMRAFQANVPGIDNIFSEKSSAANPFAKVLTRCQQSTYNIQEFGLAVSIA